MMQKKFDKKIIQQGTELLEARQLRGLIFSQGAYQAEIFFASKESFWPFLQVTDEGKIKDGLCSCTEEENGSFCSHLAALYLEVMGDGKRPLHIRFKESFWNQLCQMASRRHGYNSDCLDRQGQEIKAFSPTGKLLFFARARTEEGIEKFSEYIFARVPETEETSLKFFNVPSEEIALWKQGSPSHTLQYELSFWSDLAKWWMWLATHKKEYQITFDANDNGLPYWVQVIFKDVEFGFYIARANWPSIIPSLKTVSSPLKVEEDEYIKLKQVRYDPQLRSFFIETKEKTTSLPNEDQLCIELDGWGYLPQFGFRSLKKESWFAQNVVYEDRIASLLDKHAYLLKEVLVYDTVHEEEHDVQYECSLNEKKNFVISAYIFEPGDLQKENSAYFGSWVYLQDRGFYKIRGQKFAFASVVISQDKVSDFVNQHRTWLNSFEGFQTHLMTIESELHYYLDASLQLCFESHFELVEDKLGVIDFGEWIYIPTKGFFQKEKDRGVSNLYAGLKIPHNEISTFIRRHAYELGHVAGFFSLHCPVEAVFVDLMLTPEERIRIKPHYTFSMKVDPSRVFFFGEYCYVDKEGFSALPLRPPMDQFLEEKTLDKRQEGYFIGSELGALAPYVRLWDPRLKKISQIRLHIQEVQQDEKSKEGKWIVDLYYETDLGRVDAMELWGALQENKRYLFSAAGLIDLRQPRFNWLKNLSKKRWLKQGKQLRLTSLEWIRLNAFEQLIEPQGDLEKQTHSRALLEEFRQMRSSTDVNTKGLKSELRLYQETGLRWLWFLYTNHLSGLLCDEMGLGKTHQAMALLAAVWNAAGENKKFLIVCPTSVIYHWEDLLEKFLPSLRVRVFYGLDRTIADFEEQSDILLTSYGTLRSEKKLLSTLSFEVAVFDEIQNAKNIQSQTHKSIKTMQCHMVLGLTGTPLENRLLDLRALFEIILPGYLPQEAHFKEFFVNPIEKGLDDEKRTLLAKIVRPFIMRRKKSEVLLELPEKIEEVYFCDLSPDQKTLYREVFNLEKDAMIKDLSEGSASRGYVHVFSVLSRLKQICNHPVMINKDFENYHKYRSGKWDLFVERLEEARESGQKVVVFSQYLDMMDIIEAYLLEKKIGFAEIRGSTRNRREEIERFKNDPSCEVFVGSLQAAGAGIELTAASVVIHYDRWWNPAKENQATDRVHRMGQSRGVHVLKLITKKTIEERIHALIQKKNELFESVIGFDEQDHIKTLNRQELLELVKSIEKDIEL